jgi:hypothetical protein
MFAILQALGKCVADLFKSRCRLEPRTCFSVINSASPCGVRRLVFDYTTVIGRWWYG